MDSIDFDTFNSPANGVELTDTFETWRQKTNGIIQKVDDISNGDINLIDGSVTPTKLSTNGPSWSSTATGGVFAVQQNALEIGTKTVSDYACFVDFHSAATPTDFECRLRRDAGINGNFNITNTGTGAITLSSTGGVTFGSANMPIPSGNAPIYGARAWAKLNPLIGSVRTGAYKSGTYTTSSGSHIITIVGHGLKANDKIRLDFTSGGGDDGLYTVTSAPNADTFLVASLDGTSGSVTAQFVAIQGSGNISTASWYDSGDNRIVLNFETPMPNSNYAVLSTGHLYPNAWFSTANEDTLGTTQLNTIYQAHVAISNSVRFLSVVIFG